jgi:hypothetical protein
MFNPLTTNANFAARLMLEFFLAFLVLAGLLYLAMVPLQQWGFANCRNHSSLTCTITIFILKYGVLCAVPLYFAIFAFLHKAYTAFGPKAKDVPTSPPRVSPIRITWQIALVVVLVIANIIWLIT